MASDVDFASDSTVWEDISETQFPESQLAVVGMGSKILRFSSVIARRPDQGACLHAVQALAKTTQSLAKISFFAFGVSSPIGI